MPEFFKAWLQTLTDKHAKELWDYFDGDSFASVEVIEVVCESHQAMVEEDARQQ